MTIPLKRRILFLFGKLVSEATNATTETHWWEIALDFIVKAANEHRAVGQPVLDAVRKLQPILGERLGPYDAVTLREITADTTFCLCSSGFLKKYWEGVFGQPLQAEVVEIVLDGAMQCKFAIHLPEGVQ